MDVFIDPSDFEDYASDTPLPIIRTPVRGVRDRLGPYTLFRPKERTPTNNKRETRRRTAVREAYSSLRKCRKDLIEQQRDRNIELSATEEPLIEDNVYNIDWQVSEDAEIQEAEKKTGLTTSDTTPEKNPKFVVHITQDEYDTMQLRRLELQDAGRKLFNNLSSSPTPEEIFPVVTPPRKTPDIRLKFGANSSSKRDSNRSKQTRKTTSRAMEESSEGSISEDMDELSDSQGSGDSEPTTNKEAMNTLRFPDIAKKFSGEGEGDSDCDRFVEDLENMFTNAKTNFPNKVLTDTAKVAYAARFLAGRARRNFSSHMKKPLSSHIYKKYKNFTEMLYTLYGGKDKTKRAYGQFMHTSYKNVSVTEHFVDFERILSDMGHRIKPSFAIYGFKCGLAENVKIRMKILQRREPKTLNDCKLLALEAERDLKEDRPKRDFTHTNKGMDTETVDRRCYRCNGPNHIAVKCGIPEEKLKLLCRRCNVKGHLERDCRVKREEKETAAEREAAFLKRMGPKKDTENHDHQEFWLSAMVTISSIVPGRGGKEIALRIKFFDSITKKHILLKALIDTGATASFIHNKTVKQFGLRTKALQDTINLKVADGTESSSGVISEEVVGYKMMIKNGFRDKVPLYVTSIPGWDIILGFDWLAVHNPFINWRGKTLTFPEDDVQDSDKLNCML